MAKAVKLSEKLVSKAQTRAKAMSRSTARQIEYWANIGQLAEENPDLPYSLLKDLLIALEEARAGEVEPYQFGEGDSD